MSALVVGANVIVADWQDMVNSDPQCKEWGVAPWPWLGKLVYFSSTTWGVDWEVSPNFNTHTKLILLKDWCSPFEKLEKLMGLIRSIGQSHFTLTKKEPKVPSLWR